jgi:hypothetical protein
MTSLSMRSLVCVMVLACCSPAYAASPASAHGRVHRAAAGPWPPIELTEDDATLRRGLRAAYRRLPKSTLLNGWAEGLKIQEFDQPSWSRSTRTPTETSSQGRWLNARC